MPKSVLIYRTRDGQLPFDGWLRQLSDTNAVARVLARIGRVRRGNLGDCKPVGEGVSELRVDYGPGYRVYFGQKGSTVVILLCAGDKRTQERAIRLAPAILERLPATRKEVSHESGCETGNCVEGSPVRS